MEGLDRSKRVKRRQSMNHKDTIGYAKVNQKVLIFYTVLRYVPFHIVGGALLHYVGQEKYIVVR